MSKHAGREALQVLKATNPAAYQKLVAEQKKRRFVPHSEGQRAILESDARFIVARAGRRYGKTKVAARAMIRAAMRAPKHIDTPVVWWVGNVYKNTRRGYREVLRQLPPSFLAKQPPPPTANDLVVELKHGAARMEFYSGTNPDSMAGEGVYFVVVDEAALQSEAVWAQIIRPTLMDYSGRALLISTPRGRNWFYNMDVRGNDPQYADYASFHFTSYDNPHLPAGEVEELKLSLPDKMYRQEVMAEFLAEGGGIFAYQPEQVQHSLAEVRPGDLVVMGVDLAKTEDFTVLSAVRAGDRRVVYWERFNSVRWGEQKARIRTVAANLRSQGAERVVMVVDSTGLGDVIFDDLDDAGEDVVSQKFTQEWKSKAVRLLAADMERGEAFLFEPAVPEFDAYEYTITAAGRITYGAPEGLHDDAVSAKLLEHWGLVHELGDLGTGLRTLDTRAQEEIERPAYLENPASGAPRTTEDLLADPAVWSNWN